MTRADIKNRLAQIATVRPYKALSDVLQIDIKKFRLIAALADLTDDLLATLDRRAILNNLPDGRYTTTQTRKRLPLLPTHYRIFEV